MWNIYKAFLYMYLRILDILILTACSTVTHCSYSFTNSLTAGGNRWGVRGSLPGHEETSLLWGGHHPPTVNLDGTNSWKSQSWNFWEGTSASLFLLHFNFTLYLPAVVIYLQQTSSSISDVGNTENITQSLKCTAAISDIMLAAITHFGRLRLNIYRFSSSQLYQHGSEPSTALTWPSTEILKCI